MFSLEIIEIRTAKANQEIMNEFLSTWLEQVKENESVGKVKIYKRMNLETDYGIHIEFGGAAENGARLLGEKLASDLKEFGIVNRSIWVLQKLNSEQDEGERDV